MWLSSPKECRGEEDGSGRGREEERRGESRENLHFLRAKFLVNYCAHQIAV